MKVRSIAGFAAAAVSLLGANPAFANSSNADIIAPLRAAQAAKQQAVTGTGDEEFRQLFSSWQSLDKGNGFASASLPARTGATTVPGLVGLPSIAKPTTVSIPSRMPVEVASMTSGYGMRIHPVLGGRRAHKGIDLAAPTGTPVYASADAVVSRADWFSSYGLYISLEHGGDIETRYGHLSRLNVYAGQKVHKGDLIGYVGSTGRSTGPHLHYEVRIGGASVNPVPYLQSGEFHKAATIAKADPATTAMGDGDEE